MDDEPHVSPVAATSPAFASATEESSLKLALSNAKEENETLTQQIKLLNDSIQKHDLKIKRIKFERRFLLRNLSQNLQDENPSINEVPFINLFSGARD